MTRQFLLLLAATLALTMMPSDGCAQFRKIFEIPEVDLSDLDPTNPNGGLRKELRNLDDARLDLMSRDPRAGRDYTKVYVKNETREPIAVALRAIPLRVSRGESELKEFVHGSPWQNLLWYNLGPGQRLHVVNTNNTILYTYAKSQSGKEWAGSHHVDMGKSHNPRYLGFREQRIGIDVPEEWTFPFTSRTDGSDLRKHEIRYSVWNDSKTNVRFRLPSGKSYTLAPGETGTYHNEGIADHLKIHVFNTERDYVLTSGKHKFFWMKDKNRLGFDLRYDKD
jgi:hypothetical protein